MNHGNIVGDLAFIDRSGYKFHKDLYWSMSGERNFSEFKGDYETVTISNDYISTNKSG